MSHTRHHFKPRRSIDDFLIENLLNRVICENLRKDAMLPDETILDAFNKAYKTCIDVLAEPERQTLLSDDLGRLSANAPRSSLLRLCLTYFILSFHEEAPNLQHYLSNLKKVLEDHFNAVFSSLMAATSSLLPGSVLLDEALREPFPERQQGYVKISTLIKKALKLPKKEADTFLKILLTIIAEEESDWKELIKIAIKQNNDRIERSPFGGPYHLAKGQVATFIKLFRIIYELHIFEADDSTVASNYEEFIYKVGIFFNVEIKNIRSRLHSAKGTSNFMTVFNRLRTLANAYYKKGDGLDKKGDSLDDDSEENVQIEYQQDIEFESF